MAYNAVYDAELVIADEILPENIKWFENFIFKIIKVIGFRNLKGVCQIQHILPKTFKNSSSY